MNMPLPHDDTDLRKYIEAFADGELDVETNLRVLERMAMNPQATQRVMHQQELRRLVDRAMREQTPAVPADLRAKIQAMSRQAAADSNQNHSHNLAHSNFSFTSFLRRWSPALAASILLGVAIFLWSNRSNNNAPAPIDPPREVFHDGTFDAPIIRTDLIESGRVSRMGKRHENCAAKIEALVGSDQFSKNLTEIPTKIATYLGPQISVPIPDLSALGYEFRGAGTCGLPGGKAVHLVYKPIDGTNRTDSMSLWIRGDETNQVQIEEGKLYSATDLGSAHPIMVWRRGSAVYYLVGNTDSKLSDAASSLYAAR